MKGLFTLMMLLLCVVPLGCGGVLPGFRFAPTEPQKQIAQVSADLAQVAATTGLPPQSAAAARMVQSARVGAAYAGPPSEPVDVSDLLPPAVTRAWELMERRAEALGLKGDVLERTADITSEALAALAADIEGHAKVDTDRVVFRGEAIVQAQKMGAEIADVIPVPGLDVLSPEEAERMKRLEAALGKIQKVADAQAARRPTTAEVVEAAEGQALDTVDRVVTALEDYGLLALIPGAAGVALAVRKRKQARLAGEDADEARAEADKVRAEADKAAEDAKFARLREAEAKVAAAQAAAEATRIMLAQAGQAAQAAPVAPEVLSEA